MRSIRLLLLCALAALALPGAASAAEVGLNLNGGAGSGTPEAYDQLSDTGSKWARHFLYYDDITTEAGLQAYDRIVAEEDRRGIKTLFVVASASHQPPANPDAYAEYMAGLAKRWKGRIEALEIWNEQDEGQFWIGGPDPARYVDLLQRSYTAIKAVDPQIKVVFGPTVGHNYEFLEQAYAAGAKGYFDVMAAHTDTACNIASPMDYYRDKGRIGRYVFLGYRELRASMLANGDDKPIWLTEIGWSASQQTCSVGMWAGQKAAGVDEATQAKYLREAYHCLAEDPYVQVAMWFNNRDLSGDGSMYNSYGLVRHDGTKRPAYAALQDVARRGPGLTGPCGDFGVPTAQVLAPRSDTVIGPGQPLRIHATSPDKDVLRVTFAVKGPAGKIRSFTNDNKPLDLSKGVALEWQGAKQLPFGSHTIVVTVVDSSQNEGSAEVTFRKVDPATLPLQATKFPTVRLLGKGRVRTYTGQLKSATQFALPGKVKIEWQAKRGRKWKKIHAGQQNANAPFKFKQRLKFTGLWRVRVVYEGKKPFRRTVSKWTTFRV